MLTKSELYRMEEEAVVDSFNVLSRIRLEGLRNTMKKQQSVIQPTPTAIFVKISKARAHFDF
jgi:hypothetical protein